MADRAVRVLIADDHPVFRDGLAVLLASVPGIEVVATAATGSDAVDLAVELQPDVVVMDVQMPGLNGIDATRQLATRAPAIGVVVLTMSEEDGTVFTAVRAGARGYLVKGAEQEEIVRAITTVAAGGAVFGATLARRIADFFAAGPPTPTTAFPQLTARAGDPRTAGRRAVQRPDRHDPVPVAEDRTQQRLYRLRQAARRRPRRGDRPGTRSRTRTLTFKRRPVTPTPSARQPQHARPERPGQPDDRNVEDDRMLAGRLDPL